MSAAQAGSDGKLYSGTIDPVLAFGAGVGALMVEVAAGAVVAGAVVVVVAVAVAVVFAVAAGAVVLGAVVLAAPEVPPSFAPDVDPVAEDFGWLPPVAVAPTVSSTEPDVAPAAAP